jgi:drug/metabolite transporter (DMT)-like permease
MATRPAAETVVQKTRVFGVDRGHLVGYAFGLFTALCWGFSPILIDEGLRGLPSPLWGVTVGMSTAAVTLWTALFVRGRGHLGALPTAVTADRPFRPALWFMVLAGAISAVGAIARTTAIDVAPIVVAIPLTQTSSVWTLVFAPLFLGRHVESVPRRLVLGALLVVGGSALVILGLYG